MLTCLIVVIGRELVDLGLTQLLRIAVSGAGEAMRRQSALLLRACVLIVAFLMVGYDRRLILKSLFVIILITLVNIVSLKIHSDQIRVK